MPKYVKLVESNVGIIYTHDMKKNVHTMLLLFVVLSVIFLMSCSNKGNAANNNLTPGKVFKKGMTMTVTTQGKKEYVIDADKLIISETNDTFVHGDMVKVAFYNEQNVIENTISSDKGKFDIRNKDVVLTGNVILKNAKENIIVYTEELIYSAQNKKIHSSKQVKMERDGGVVYGDSMETDLSLNEITLQNIRGSK